MFNLVLIDESQASSNFPAQRANMTKKNE